MTLYDALITHAEVLTQEQLFDGSFSYTMNGPYRQKETPVRATAHAICTLAWAYQQTQQPFYIDALKRAGSYLLRTSYYKQTHYVCFEDGIATEGNGTIGQAWVIEALVALFETTKNDLYKDRAATVFLAHQFDDVYHVWGAFDYNESEFLDTTFNHQLWFAYSGTLLLKHTDNIVIRNRVNLFIEAAHTLMHVCPNGEIEHRIYSIINRSLYSRFLYRSKDVVKKLFFPMRRSDVLNTGYLTFTLLAWDYICREYVSKEHPINDIVKKSYALLDCQEWLKAVDANSYTYAYNVFGFEFLALKKCLDASVRQAVQKQYSYIYDGMFEHNIPDKKILKYRMYELCRVDSTLLQQITVS